MQFNSFDNVDIMDIYFGFHRKEHDMSDFSAFQFEEPGPVEGAWLLSPLEDLIPTGEYAGIKMVAADAVLLIADKIEKDGIAPEGRKALADLLRYLVQVPLQRPDQS